jgi:D-glycero-D-manno-heptose 1,7-bisphosphate phosphatase
VGGAQTDRLLRNAVSLGLSASWPSAGRTRAPRAELGLDLRRSTMVGDKASDLVPGRAVGAATELVLTGYGRGEWEYRRAHFAVEPDHVAGDLLDAVDWALARPVTA